MRRRRLALAALTCLLPVLVSGVTLAQMRFRRSTPPGVMPPDRSGVPDWKVDEKFKNDVFTFVRVEYDSYGRYGGGRRGWDSWATDWPDSDLNFSFRLQQLTSLKVNPVP